MERRSYKTLEFWLTAVAMLIGLVMMIIGGVVEDPDTSKVYVILGMVAEVLASMGYGFMRTSQKKAAVLENIAKMTGGAPKP